MYYTYIITHTLTSTCTCSQYGVTLHLTDCKGYGGWVNTCTIHISLHIHLQVHVHSMGLHYI